MERTVQTISRRRGIAMVMVLVVVAVASIMAYAVLASASLGTKVADTTTTRIQRKYLAESGLNLALYYLYHPEASPVSLVWGDWGNVHYPGETNISLGSIPGTLTIQVTNTANGVFEITSDALLGNDKHSASAVVKLDKYRTFDRAANLLSNITLTNRMSITGGLSTLGSVVGAGSITGLISATNGPSVGGITVPASALTSHPVSMTHYLPYYFVNGNRYTAKRLTTGNVLLTLLDLDLINNPYNVWYTTNNVNFFLTTTMAGTFVTTNGANVTMQGNLTINPNANLPALVCDGNLAVSGTGRNLKLNGPVYLKNQITSSSTSTTNRITVNGVFISGNTGTLVNGYLGFIDIVYDANRAKVQGVMDEIEPIHAMTVRSWQTSNGSSQ